MPISFSYRRAIWLPRAVPLAGALAFMLLAGAVAGSGAPGASTSIRLEAAGRDTRVGVFRPVVPPIGLVVIAHGFSRSSERHADLARALAEAGFLVAVPDLPYFADHSANGAAIRDVAHAVARATPGAPADLPIVLVGFSAGGLAALLAADEVAGLVGWIGLDPVDLRGQGETAAQSLGVPAMVIRAPPSSCNANGNGARIVAALPETNSEDLVVEGASHCDFEDPGTVACVVACGPDDGERRKGIRRAVVSAALAMVRAPQP